MADIYNFIYYGVSFVWLYKIQILGSFFVSLTLFEYFYKQYLLPIRKRQIAQLRNYYKALRKMEETHKLEHLIITEKMEQISKEVERTSEMLLSQVKINHKALLIQSDAEFGLINYRINKIDEQSTDALNKISTLEKETDFIRAIKKYRYVVGLALLGLISITNFEKIHEWVSSLVPWN